MLWLVTQGGQSVSGYETRVSVDQGAMWGAARVIAEEHPDLWGGSWTWTLELWPIVGVALLVRHILSRDGEDQIALRGERRFVLRLGSGHGEGRPKAFQWRPDSTYLITGGFGDIGLLVARARPRRALDDWFSSAARHCHREPNGMRLLLKVRLVGASRGYADWKRWEWRSK